MSSVIRISVGLGAASAVPHSGSLCRAVSHMCIERLLAFVDYRTGINVGDALHVPIIQAINMPFHFDQAGLLGRLKATGSL